VSLPAAVSLYPPSLVFGDSSLHASASLHRFPIAVTIPGRAGQEEIVRIDGTLGCGGTAASPTGSADLRVDFADWPKLSRYAVKIGATYGPAAVPAATGIEGRIDVTRDSSAVLIATMDYPLVLCLDPPSARPIAGGDLRLDVDSDGISAGDLDPLLPADIGLGGLVRIHIEGSGPREKAALAGSVVTDDFEVVVAEKARVLAKAKIALSGSTARPELKGEIEIKSALINVPDRPKGLHPFEGGALLLPDTTHAQRPAEPAPARGRRAPLKSDIDLDIRIPNGFWIRGKGLDIELSGDLSVKQKDGAPVITGELRAIRGTLAVLGRSFALERGTVTFYGGDEINPSLDVSLSTTVEETKIEILVGGTAQKPTVAMESDPEMSEADIVSVLLFGKPYGSLDEGQEDLVKKRSTEMLVSLGAAKLQAELGEQLGVDVVTVSSAGPGDDRTTLSLGKYLSPRVLLSYAYAMGTESDSYVHLEYFLRGRFKVESAFGFGGRTALGVGWSKDY
jgi:hypothetical protein